MRTITAALLSIAFTFVPTRSFGQCGFRETRKVVAADGATRDLFGASVSLRGSVALVGSPGDDDRASGSGAAYVLRWNGTAWRDEQKLVASDGSLGALFGSAVSVSDNVAVVGAPLVKQAYVFRYDGSAWVEEQILRPATGAVAFGAVVSVAGNVALVGDPDNRVLGTNAGAAFVFRWNGTQWVEDQVLVPHDAAAFHAFGSAVAISGDAVVIGAPHDGEHGYRAGAAYLFRWNGTLWSEEQKFTASDAANNDLFGTAVALLGNVAVCGAPGDDDRGLDSGSAYVFAKQGSLWSEAAKLSASDGTDADAFAAALSASGDTVMVGAPYDDDRGSSSGSVYVFRAQGTSWVEAQKLTASDGTETDEFGGAVSLDGDVVMVGARLDDEQGLLAGAAYVFRSSHAAWTNYGTGLPGTLGIPALTADRDPTPCSDVRLALGNSRGTATFALVMFGFADADLPTPWGGRLLLQPVAYLSIALSGLPGTGAEAPLAIPCHPEFCGIEARVQVLELDPGAARGVSFTPGLDLRIGD